MATIRRSRSRGTRLALLGLAVAVAAVVLPLAWYLGSPLFIDKAVSEGFQMVTLPQATPAAGLPVAAAPTEPPAPAPSPTTAPTASTPEPAHVTPTPPEPSATAVAVAPSAIATPAPAAAAATPTPLAAPPATATPVPVPSPPTPAPVGPVALAAGQFGVVDTVHRGEGTATIFRLPDGRRILRLTGFRVTNGPDLYVYLSGHPAPRSSEQLHQGADLEVARLKGNVGDQNYDLPADLDLDGVQSVVIYCKRFTTVFSTAELATAR